MARDTDGEDGSAFSRHVDFFADVAGGGGELGAVPADLANVFVELSLGSPAVCASRAPLRLAPDLKPESPAILDAAAQIAVHTLRESLGLVDAQRERIVREVAAALREVLSIRTSSLEMDEIRLRGSWTSIRKLKVRCRFALRFGDLKDESDKVVQHTEAQPRWTHRR